MREMRTETSKLTKEFKLEQEQLKQNGTETDKLKSKVEYLKKAHDISAQSVKETETQLSKAKSTYGENSKEVKNLEDKLLNAQLAEQKLANEVKSTSEELKKQGNEALKETSDKLDKFAKKTKEIGGSLSKTITAPIVAMGGAAVKFATDFETSIAKVSTISEETEVPIGDLRKSIMNLSSDTGVASSEIAENVYQAISAGQKTGDAVGFVANATKLAKAGFAETGQAVDLLSTIMNSYGLEAEDVTRVSDILINTQNKGKTSVAELSANMGKVIPTAKAYGVNLEQVSSGYVMLTSKGIKSAEATTYLNSMLNEMGKTGTKSSDIIKELSDKSFQELIADGRTVGDVLAIMQDHGDKNNLSLADMFGSSEAAKAGMILASDSGKEFNTVLESMGNVAGATDEAFSKISETTGFKMKQALNDIKNMGIEIGDILLPVVKDLATKFRDLLQKFKDLSPGTKKIIVAIGGILATIGPLLLIIGTLAGSIVNIMNLGTKTIPVFAKLGGVFKTIGVFLGGLSLPIILITAAIIALVGGIIYLWNTNEGFRAAIIEIWNSILETGQNVWGWLVKFFTEDIPNAWQSVLDFFNLTVPQWLQSMSDWFAQLPQIIKQWLIDTYNNIVNWGNDTYNNMNQSANNAINAVANWFSTLPGKVWEWLSTTISNVRTFASNLASEAWNAGSNMVTNLINTVSELPSKMLDIGKNIVTGLWEGITGMMGWLGDRIKSFTNNVVQGFKDGMQIKSPSRKMMILGEYTTEGFAIGMEDKIKAVKETIKDIVGVTTDGFDLANNNNLAFSGAGISNMSNYANTSNSNQFIINATVREEGDIDKLTDNILYKMESKRRGSAMGRGEY